MRLHFAPRTRSIRARWLIEELEVPCELVKVDPSQPAAPPLPTLLDGEAVLTEPLAIALHLADRFPEKGFAPPVGSPARAEYLQWLVFAESVLEPLVMEQFRNPQ